MKKYKVVQNGMDDVLSLGSVSAFFCKKDVEFIYVNECVFDFSQEFRILSRNQIKNICDYFIAKSNTPPFSN